MRWTEVPAGTLNRATQEFWRALGDHAGDVAERMKTDSVLAKKIAALARGASHFPSEQQVDALLIMKENFIHVGDVMAQLGIDPRREDLDALKHIPYRKETLRGHRDTHVLVPVFPVSADELMKRMKGSQFVIRCPQPRGRYVKEKSLQHAYHQAGSARWILVPKQCPQELFACSWDMELGKLPAEEDVLTLQQCMFAAFAYFMIRGGHLHDARFVRCADVVGQDEHLIAKFYRHGTFHYDEFEIDTFADEKAFLDVGLATVVRPDA